MSAGQALARPLAPSDLSPAWATAVGLEMRVEQFAAGERPPLEVRLFVKPGHSMQTRRLVDTARASLALFSQWFGPFGGSSLTVVDLPWGVDPPAEAIPGVVTTRTSWVAFERDTTAERVLIAAIGRQFWMRPVSRRGATPFLAGLDRYVAMRGVHAVLENRQFAVPRYFGGLLPFPIRSVPLSPRPVGSRPLLRWFPGAESAAANPWRGALDLDPDDAERVTLALQTLERYLGWPAMQQALESLRGRFRKGDVTADDLAAIIGEQRGSALDWYFAEAFGSRRRFDYGIAHVTTAPDADAPGRFRTTVTLRRFGDAVFAGTSQPRGASPAGARSLPVLIRFADGAELRDHADGRDETAELVYESPAPAVSATVDPDTFLVLDPNRANNTWTVGRRVHVSGMRLALHWMLWLQDVMLTYTAVA